ncbi:MAG: divergent PAP2 family protein [Acutalibacteraceae bacterium]|jgi:acid phosphatase family membrane protein YuiD
MDVFVSLIQNRVLLAATLGWFFAQMAKVALEWLLHRRFSVERLWGAGGMPSAHSAMVCALTVSLARFDGVSSPVFALAVIFAFVTIYDAMGVRREAGEHAKLLNKYFNRPHDDENGDETEDVELKEFIGHTPLEVLGGVLLGILVGVLVPA